MTSQIKEKRIKEILSKFDDIAKGIKRCPKCSGTESKIVERNNYRHVGSRIGRFGTRSFYYFDAVRECSNCEAKFTTSECEEK